MILPPKSGLGELHISISTLGSVSLHFNRLCAQSFQNANT